MEFDVRVFEMIFQLFNILIWVGIIYWIFKLITKLPKKIRKHENRLESIENILEEINKKAD